MVRPDRASKLDPYKPYIEHQTTGAQPLVRWQEEVTALQPYRVRPEDHYRVAEGY